MENLENEKITKDSIRVMTFNLRCDRFFDANNRWDMRKSMVYYLMNEYGCDIIGTQEVEDNMFMDIEENVTGYNIIGEARSKKMSSERNNLLISKKYFIQKQNTFWLSETPSKVGSRIWYSYLPRICTLATVRTDKNEKIRIGNCHLDNFLPQAREYQLQKLMEIIEEEQKIEELPIILMGDFNDTPDSKLIRNFKNGKFFKKKLTPVQDINRSLYNEATRDKFERTNRGVHIDYIFVSEEIDVINAEIIKYNIEGKYPSDHYPLMADIKIKS